MYGSTDQYFAICYNSVKAFLRPYADYSSQAFLVFHYYCISYSGLTLNLKVTKIVSGPKKQHLAAIQTGTCRKPTGHFRAVSCAAAYIVWSGLFLWQFLVKFEAITWICNHVIVYLLLVSKNSIHKATSLQIGSVWTIDRNSYKSWNQGFVSENVVNDEGSHFIDKCFFIYDITFCLNREVHVFLFW